MIALSPLQLNLLWTQSPDKCLPGSEVDGHHVVQELGGAKTAFFLQPGVTERSPLCHRFLHSRVTNPVQLMTLRFRR